MPKAAYNFKDGSVYNSNFVWKISDCIRRVWRKGKNTSAEAPTEWEGGRGNLRNWERLANYRLTSIRLDHSRRPIAYDHQLNTRASEIGGIKMLGDRVHVVLAKMTPTYQQMSGSHNLVIERCNNTHQKCRMKTTITFLSLNSSPNCTLTPFCATTSSLDARSS